MAVTAGDLPAARQAYQQGLDIAARLAQADPDNAQAQRDLSISHGKLGDLAERREDTTQAIHHFTQARDLTAARFGHDHNDTRYYQQRLEQLSPP